MTKDIVPFGTHAAGMLTQDQVRGWIAHLPELVRPAALKFWACRRHIANFESPLTLVSNLMVWMNDYGLEPEDANLILIKMLAPGQMSNHQFASQLMSALDAEVAKTLKMRKEEQDFIEQRKAGRG